MLTEHGCTIAPNTYWVAKKRPPSARALRDEELKPQILRVHSENLDVYGADKVWTQLNPHLHRRLGNPHRYIAIGWLDATDGGSRHTGDGLRRRHL